MAFYKEKIDIAVKALNDNNYDMWIIAGQESATNSEPVLDIMTDGEFIGCTAVIFNKDGSSCVVCTPLDCNGYIHAGVFTEVIAFSGKFEEAVGEYIAKKAPKTIALDFSVNNPASDGLTVGNFRLLEKAFKIAGFEGEIVSAQPIVNLVRGVKLPHEIEKIRKACAVTQEIFDAAKDFIKPGMNCQDIYKFFEDEVERRRVGYSWPKSCNPGVLSGYGCPSGHMGAPDFPVKAGDVVNIDFGIVVDGYASDMQRMYYLLEPGETDAPEEVKHAFNTVRDSIRVAMKAMVPGVTGLEVDTICRESIVAGGFNNYGHATGHQLGRVAHDGGPLLGPRKPRYDRPDLIEVPLLENFVFAVEPAVGTSRGNVAIEEEVIITPTGGEFLSPAQEEIYLIG